MSTEPVQIRVQGSPAAVAAAYAAIVATLPTGPLSTRRLRPDGSGLLGIFGDFAAVVDVDAPPRGEEVITVTAEVVQSRQRLRSRYAPGGREIEGGRR